MKIYVDDNDFKCHASNPNGIFREIEDKFFDGKCAEFIKGYCREEEGESVLHYPWKDYNELDAAQRSYEQQLLTEYETKENELNDSYNEGINSI